MSKCPFCGAEIPEGITNCWVCQRQLVYKESTARAKQGHGSTVIASFLLGFLLFLTLALLGYMLSFLDVRLTGLYALFINLLLGGLGAKGRYSTPTLRQTLVTLLIGLVPILGTAYITFFSGRSLATNRGMRFTIYLALVVSLALLVFWKVRAGEFDLAGRVTYLFHHLNTPTPSSTPTATQISIPTPNATIRSSPIATSSPTVTLVALESHLEDCVYWSSVTLDWVGKNTCVYGDYLNISQKQDKTYVLNFSGEPGTFQVWSYPKPFEPYLPKDGSHCVVIRGWIQTSGIRPIVVIGPKGKIEPCP